MKSKRNHYYYYQYQYIITIVNNKTKRPKTWHDFKPQKKNKTESKHCPDSKQKSITNNGEEKNFKIRKRKSKDQIKNNCAKQKTHSLTNTTTNSALNKNKSRKTKMLHKKIKSIASTQATKRQANTKTKNTEKKQKTKCSS